MIIVSEAISGPPEDISAIRQTATRMVEALERQDVDALMEGFSEDVVIIPQGEPILKGKAAVRVFYRGQFEHYRLKAFGPSLDELVICGEWAFSRGTGASLVKSSENGRTVRAFNRGLEIWRKQPDGSWKIARAMGNR